MPFKFNLGRGIIERVSNTERERVSVSENRERDPRIKERYRAFGDIEHTERGTESRAENEGGRENAERVIQTERDRERECKFRFHITMLVTRRETKLR